MGFVTWHYLARIGAIVLLPLVVVRMMAEYGTVWSALGLAAWVALIVLGLTGAILAVLLLFTRFRFSCPRCRQRSTQFDSRRGEGMWLYCEDCGLEFREAGLLKLKLTCEKVELESDPSSGRNDPA